MMSWLRIDDGFSRHPKVTALTPKERWVWMDVLCYCASYQTGGYLPENMGGIVPGATTRFLARCSELRLVNVVHGRLRVHDWHVYNGTIAERVEHFLSENPDATANEVHKAVGGTREVVLAEVKRIKGGSERTDPGGSGGTGFGGSETGSESGSRARAPHPPPKSESSYSQDVSSFAGDDAHASQGTNLDRLYALARSDEDREKVKRAIQGLPEFALVNALEAAQGPAVRDRLGAALARLAKLRRDAA